MKRKFSILAILASMVFGASLSLKGSPDIEANAATTSVKYVVDSDTHRNLNTTSALPANSYGTTTSDLSSLGKDKTHYIYFYNFCDATISYMILNTYSSAQARAFEISVDVINKATNAVVINLCPSIKSDFTSRSSDDIDMKFDFSIDDYLFKNDDVLKVTLKTTGASTSTKNRINSISFGFISFNDEPRINNFSFSKKAIQLNKAYNETYFFNPVVEVYKDFSYSFKVIFGTNDIVGFDNENQLFYPINVGKTNVTVFIQENENFYVEFQITVIEKLETGIEITSNPTTIYYHPGEKLNTKGLTVSLKYETNELVAITDYSIENLEHIFDETDKSNGYYEYEIKYHTFSCFLKVLVADVFGVDSGNYLIINKNGIIFGATIQTTTTAAYIPSVTAENAIAWNFRRKGDYQYTISYDGNYLINNKAGTTGMATFNTNAAKNNIWKLVPADEDGFFYIQDSSTSRWLRYDGGNGWKIYSAFSDSYSAMVKLVEEKDFFIETFLNKFTKNCDSNGNTTISNLKWDKAKAQYDSMSIENKNLFRNAQYIYNGVNVTAVEGTRDDIAQYVARYDYIISKYGTAKFVDYIGRIDSEYNLFPMSSRPGSQIIVNEMLKDNGTSLIMVVGIIGLTSIGAFLFYRRKHENY